MTIRAPELDTIPCGCCYGSPPAAPVLWPADEDDPAGWSWRCDCGAEARGDGEPPTLRRQLLHTPPLKTHGDRYSGDVQVRNTLRALGLSDADLAALAGGATLTVCDTPPDKEAP